MNPRWTSQAVSSSQLTSLAAFSDPPPPSMVRERSLLSSWIALRSAIARAQRENEDLGNSPSSFNATMVVSWRIMSSAFSTSLKISTKSVVQLWIPKKSAYTNVLIRRGGCCEIVAGMPVVVDKNPVPTETFMESKNEILLYGRAKPPWSSHSEPESRGPPNGHGSIITGASSPSPTFEPGNREFADGRGGCRRGLVLRAGARTDTGLSRSGCLGRTSRFGRGARYLIQATVTFGGSEAAWVTSWVKWEFKQQR